MAAGYRTPKKLSACVFERKDGPVDKACGGDCPPVERYEQLGVTIKNAYPFDGIRYLNAKNVEEFADGHFSGVVVGVRRLELHRALTEKLMKQVFTSSTHANEVVLADDSVSVNGGGSLSSRGWPELPLQRRFELEGAKPSVHVTALVNISIPALEQ